jgi:hypothetical protein
MASLWRRGLSFVLVGPRRDAQTEMLTLRPTRPRHLSYSDSRWCSIWPAALRMQGGPSEHGRGGGLTVGLES